jgi:hypothetical protein
MSNFQSTFQSWDREVRRVIDPLNIGQKMMQNYGILPSDPVPSATTNVPASPTDASVQEAASKELDAIKKKRAASSTLLTSPAGIQENPPILKQTLG